MPSHNFDSSSAADRAAKKAGRFFSGKVYNTKGQAEAARKAKASVGGGLSKADGRTRSNAGPSLTTEVVVISQDHTMTAGACFGSLDLLSDAAAPELLALKARNGKVLGVRAELNFPLDSAKTRWAVATVHQLSAGDKTVAQVAKVRGAQVFDNGDYVDKWLTMSDVGGVINPQDVMGNSLLKDVDHRNVVFAMQTLVVTAGKVVNCKWHVTVQVDAAASVAVVDL
jgi:hypothetical protein